jgi:hypothetical protein
LEIQKFGRPSEHVPSAVERDQQKQIIVKMAGNMPGKTNEEK